MINDKEITINPKKTYTKSEYARAYAISRPTIDKLIVSKLLKATHINGTILVHAS